jgi:hypothetical protein
MLGAFAPLLQRERKSLRSRDTGSYIVFHFSAVAPVVQVEDDDNIYPRDLRRRHLAVAHDHTDQRKGVKIVQS